MKTKYFTNTQLLLGLSVVALLVACPLPASSTPLYLEPYNDLSYFQASTPQDDGSPHTKFVLDGLYFTDWNTRSHGSHGSLTGQTPFSCRLQTSAETDVAGKGYYNTSSVRQIETYLATLSLAGDPGAQASISLDAEVYGSLYAYQGSIVGYGYGEASIYTVISVEQPATGYKFEWTPLVDDIELAAVSVLGATRVEKDYDQTMNRTLDGLVMEVGNSLTNIQLTMQISGYATGESVGLPKLGGSFCGAGAPNSWMAVTFLPQEILPDAVPEPCTVLLLGCGLIGFVAYGGKKCFKK